MKPSLSQSKDFKFDIFNLSCFAYENDWKIDIFNIGAWKKATREMAISDLKIKILSLMVFECSAASNAEGLK